MTGWRPNLSRQTLSIAAAALTALVIFGRLPGDTKLTAALQDTAHAPAFFLLALIAMCLCSGVMSGMGRGNLPGLGRYLISFVCCILVGIAIEGVQALIGSDVSINDVWTDSLGILAGLSAYAYLISGRSKTKLAALCVLCVLVACAPLGWTLAAYCNRALHFPVLAQFNSPLDLYFLRPRVTVPKLSPGNTLLVPLGDETWPGVAIEEPAPDWSGYQLLNVEMSNPGATALPLTLRIFDQAHSEAVNDRFNLRFELPAGSSKRLSIPLSQIRCAPATRQMDMTRIADLIIYGHASLAGKAFYLNRIWLE